MIFVDTGGWYATFIPEDRDYAAASSWFGTNSLPLLTTDFIVDETLTLMRSRQQNAVAQALGRRFFSGSLATIYYLTEEDVYQAWLTFEQYADKEWSFTDCTSKVVMEKFGITLAFTFDHHFQQFGTVAVVP